MMPPRKVKRDLERGKVGVESLEADISAGKDPGANKRSATYLKQSLNRVTGEILFTIEQKNSFKDDEKQIEFSHISPTCCH